MLIICIIISYMLKHCKGPKSLADCSYVKKFQDLSCLLTIISILYVIEISYQILKSDFHVFVLYFISSTFLY